VAFGCIVLTTGPIWARPIWGVYWTWEPRLLTSLLSVLVYVAYVVLRGFAGDGDAERKFAAADTEAQGHRLMLGQAREYRGYNKVGVFDGQGPDVRTTVLGVFDADLIEHLVERVPGDERAAAVAAHKAVTDASRAWASALVLMAVVFVMMTEPCTAFVRIPASSSGSSSSSSSSAAKARYPWRGVMLAAATELRSMSPAPAAQQPDLSVRGGLGKVTPSASPRASP
jgi:hypothetical protein